MQNVPPSFRGNLSKRAGVIENYKLRKVKLLFFQGRPAVPYITTPVGTNRGAQELSPNIKNSYWSRSKPRGLTQKLQELAVIGQLTATVEARRKQPCVERIDFWLQGQMLQARTIQFVEFQSRN